MAGATWVARCCGGQTEATPQVGRGGHAEGGAVCAGSIRELEASAVHAATTGRDREPGAGECGAGHAPGDGSGCTWKLLSVSKAVNASCATRGVDAAIAAWGARCLDGCSAADRADRRSECYNVCFAAASAARRLIFIYRHPGITN